MSNVKNQILEQLVRKCICEVLDTMNIKEVGKSVSYEELKGEFDLWHENFKKNGYSWWVDNIKRGLDSFSKEIIPHILKLPSFVKYARTFGQEHLEQIADTFARQVASEYARFLERTRFQLHPRQEESIGAPAPPAEGQGTADQPPIPKEINELKKVIKKMVRKTLSK